MNWELWLSGLMLGSYAGIAPGPTTTMVIVQSVRFGRAEGFKVAIAPLLTDAPIVLLSVWVLATLRSSDRILAVVSAVGAAMLLYFAFDCFRATRPDAEEPDDDVARHSILKGVVANALNPHPYLTWIAVAGAWLVDAWRLGWWVAALFLVCMYVPMVGLKMAIAAAADAGRAWVHGRAYLWIVRGLGLVLVLLALRFAARAAELWNGP